MATEQEIEAAADEVMDVGDQLIDDTDRWSMDESAEIAELLADHFKVRASTLREEAASMNTMD
jgi:hypothetical protein